MALPSDLLLNIDPDLVNSQEPADRLKLFNNLSASLKQMYTDLAEAINQVPEYAEGGGAPGPAENSFQVWKDGGGDTWLAYNDAGTVKKMQFDPPAVVIPVEVPAGSKMAFYQAAAPTGWTQDTSVNDRVLRVVSGAGGGTGGNWTISGLTVDGHVLTVEEMPAHTHSYTKYLLKMGASAQGTSVWISDASADSGATGGDAAHSHGLSADGAWRPAYIDVIIASKN
jgi:hypothetical protein